MDCTSPPTFSICRSGRFGEALTALGSQDQSLNPEDCGVQHKNTCAIRMQLRLVAWMLNNLYQLKCMSDATGVRSCTPSRQLQTAAFQCLHIKRRPWPLVEISAKYGMVSSSCFF